MLTILNNPDGSAEILTALEVAADALGVDICWYYRGDFHFRLRDGWTVSITPETAERLRVETWIGLRRRDRKWARSGDCDRLRWLVRNAHEAALDPA
jgi:hypothetical protein